MKDIIVEMNRIRVLVMRPAFLNRTGKVRRAPPNIEFSIAEIVTREL